MWILKEELDKTRSTVECIGIDPGALDKSRFRLSKLEQQLIGMEEILGYIMEALQIMEIPPEPQEQAGRSLYKRLEIHSMRSQLVRRATDVKKIVESTKKCLIVLEKKQDRSLESKIEHLYDGMQRNIKAITDLQSSQDESANILRMALSVFVGTVSFHILDRVTGDWTLSNIKWVQKFLDYVTQKNSSLWLFITVSMWTIVTHLVQTKVRKAAWNSKGIMELEWISNEQIQSDKIRFLLEMKANVLEKRQYELDREIVIVSYDEPDSKIWGGSAPNITLEYDERNQFLLRIKVRRNIRNGVKEFLSSEDLKHKVLADLTHQRIFKISNEAQNKEI